MLSTTAGQSSFWPSDMESLSLSKDFRLANPPAPVANIAASACPVNSVTSKISTSRWAAPRRRRHCRGLPSAKRLTSQLTRVPWPASLEHLIFTNQPLDQVMWLTCNLWLSRRLRSRCYVDQPADRQRVVARTLGSNPQVRLARIDTAAAIQQCPRVAGGGNHLACIATTDMYPPGSGEPQPEVPDVEVFRIPVYVSNHAEPGVEVFGTP